MPTGMAFWGFLTSSPVSGRTQPTKARQRGPPTNPQGAWGFPMPSEPVPPRGQLPSCSALPALGAQVALGDAGLKALMSQPG